MIAPFQGLSSRSPQLESPYDDVVEIGLLLPKNRAAALLALAKDRHETVGQILRKLVDRALAGECLS